MHFEPPAIPWGQLPVWTHTPAVRTTITKVVDFAFRVGLAEGGQWGLILGLAVGFTLGALVTSHLFRTVLWTPHR